MNHDSGYGTNGIPYEYTVREAKSKALMIKKISLIALYCVWAGGWLFIGLWFQIIVPFLALIPLSLWILVFFTWRITQIEYEYTFFSGVLTVCKISGSRSRKKLAEITIRDIDELYPCTDDFAAKIDAFHENKTIFAASGLSSPSMYAALWNDEENGKTALYFEPNDKALKILRYYNFSIARTTN